MEHSKNTINCPNFVVNAMEPLPPEPQNVGEENVIAAKRLKSLIKSNFQQQLATAQQYGEAIHVNKLQAAFTNNPADLQTIVDGIAQLNGRVGAIDDRLENITTTLGNITTRLDTVTTLLTQQQRTTTLAYQRNLTIRNYDDSPVYFFPALVADHPLPEDLPRNRSDLFEMSAVQCAAIEAAYGIPRVNRIAERRDNIANFIGVSF